MQKIGFSNLKKSLEHYLQSRSILNYWFKMLSCALKILISITRTLPTTHCFELKEHYKETSNGV